MEAAATVRFRRRERERWTDLLVSSSSRDEKEEREVEGGREESVSGGAKDWASLGEFRPFMEMAMESSWRLSRP